MATAQVTATARVLAGLPAEQIERFFASLTPVEALALEHDWPFWARPEQLPPTGDWLTWVIKAGRGFGKTRPGAEWAIAQAKALPGCRIALVGKEPDDYRDTMIQGEAGILKRSPPWFRPTYQPSLRKVTWPNGSLGFCYSSETPDDLRGPAHHKAWLDEFCKFKHPKEVWDNLMLGLRLGDNPQALVTTTPRPIPIFKTILTDPKTVATGGSTYDNLPNLAPTFRDYILRQYEGTRLGRQELYAEMLEDVLGALWKRDWLERNRRPGAPGLVRVVVAIDPSASDADREGAAEAGIMVGGKGEDGEGYLLQDCSVRGSPDQWARRAVRAYRDHHADAIVAEANNGGEMVRLTLSTVDSTVPVKLVYASRGKYTRAEPISALDEQGRLHLCGSFPELEDQLCTWVPGEKSPDRLDAYVWLFTELGLQVPLALVATGADQPVDEETKAVRAVKVIEDAIRERGVYWPGGN